MRRNQNGFSAVVVLLVIAVMGLIGGTGWYVWQNQEKNNKSPSASSHQSTSKGTNSVEMVDTDITDVDLSLEAEADINKLPTATPASFKSYMREKLKSNSSATGCEFIKFQVTKISAVNILGGKVPGRDPFDCSGAPALWVLTPSGKWDEESTQEVVPCKSTNGGLVYEEFGAECYNGSKTVKNPNGSIKSVAQ